MLDDVSFLLNLN